MESSSNSITTVRSNGGIRIENPFTLKVGQVFTGFGIGCGVGIGVGRPINLGAIPVMNQVMTATRGATDAFSGVSKHVNDSLRKLGAKNIEAGIGCGVGFGHGFGIGLAVKPGVVNQIQSCLMQATIKLMMKLGIAPNLSAGQGLPVSHQNGMSMISGSSNQNPTESIIQMATKVPGLPSQILPRDGNLETGSTSGPIASKSNAPDMFFGSQTEKVISNFLEDPVLVEENTELNKQAERLRSENNILQMVLKHQQIIEELMEENEKLRQILMEDLKVPASKLLQNSPYKNRSPCIDCFECRRRHRKR